MSDQFFIIFFGSEGEGEDGSSCRTNARCLRRPVIRAADEFRAVPHRNDKKIIEKLREFNTSLRPIILLLNNRKTLHRE